MLPTKKEQQKCEPGWRAPAGRQANHLRCVLREQLLSCRVDTNTQQVFLDNRQEQRNYYPIEQLGRDRSNAGYPRDAL